ncbi:AraC family transcriptional regulator [Sulfurovum mangrovi]|uniref:AraC family transcriptional regulator n=1 Tax=Sulfurovum mangrovi TaxID=2893889 RepID=UPI001E331F0A|nr:GyrI-like domain-containing protein [Sulfurovum mangrovi]UFH59538.1 AraC family transcriptional regulator [Sulfurovum mangrovi]
MKKETLEKRTKLANDMMYYIYTHIDTHIDIEELSEDLDVSRFHMHRIFKEAFGKNIYESIKSIRLQKAANLLLTNKYSTISNVANECGYSSQSSFIKVFKERFGMTPKAWRQGGYKCYSNEILRQSKNAMRSQADFSAMTPTIVKMPSIESYYIRNRGYDVNVKETWQKMQTWILSHDIRESTQIALLHDNPTITPLAECQYIACVTTPKEEKVNSQRLPKFKISDGVYAKFDLQGKHGDMLKFIHWVYHEWLVKSDYETTTKPSYVIYKKNNFLSEDDEFDISFYVSITY